MTDPDFELHVLVGEPALFGPDMVDMADLCRPLGPGFRAAPTGWLGASQPSRSHDVLIGGGDRRVEVMARSLAVEFGGALRPCLLLPSLASPSGRVGACDMLAALVAALAREGETAVVLLHGVDLAGTARSLPILQDVLTALSSRGVPARLPEDPVLVIPENIPAGRIMARNRFASALANEVARQAPEFGLGCSDADGLVTSCAASLATLSLQGLEPSAEVGSEPFRRLASTMLRHLFAGPSVQPIRS